MPPRSSPSVSKLLMPRLLWPSADISSFCSTLCRLTARGTAMPCSFPSVLIHIHLALWTWPAIIRTVRRGAPGTVAPHTSLGRCSTRKTVTRLLVLQASSSISRWSSADFIRGLHQMIKADSGLVLYRRCAAQIRNWWYYPAPLTALGFSSILASFPPSLEEQDDPRKPTKLLELRTSFRAASCDARGSFDLEFLRQFLKRWKGERG